MELTIRKYLSADLEQMIDIWNQIVESAVAFPQTELLTLDTAQSFFGSQTFTAVAVLDGKIVGLYILHPNNIGRCSHIANASYGVRADMRGKKIGQVLVVHSMDTAKALSFKILQFNAVVTSNKAAISLYKSLGFTPLGVIPGGFRKDDGSYEDIIPFYHDL